MPTITTFLIVAVAFVVFCIVAVVVATLALFLSKAKPKASPIEELLKRESHEIQLDNALHEHVTIVDRIQRRRSTLPQDNPA